MATMTVTTKSFTSHGLCFHRLKQGPRVSKTEVSLGCWKKEGGEMNGLSVRCVGGERNVRVDKVNGKEVNGAVVSGSDTISNVNGDGSLKNFKLGRFVEKRLVYRQTFVIRSYEIGPDKTATMETLMNLLQETALNHVMSSGLAGDGFGVTHEMTLRKLIWVVTRINIQVDKYSRW